MASENIFQYYTIVSDADDNLPEYPSDELALFEEPNAENAAEDNKIMFFTFNDDQILANGVGKDAESALRPFEFVTLNGGQIFVSNGDKITEPEEELLTSANSNGNDVKLEEPLIETSELHTSGNEDQLNFKEILLEDGTTAIIDNDLWNKLIANTLKQEAAEEDIQKKNKRFPCLYEGCDKVYTTAHHLTVHVRNHTGVRPYICKTEGCNKAFATGYSLKAHQRTHTGEKPYGCSICMKHFKTSGDLQKHFRTHTGEKPFKCPIKGCDWSFTTSNIRKVHIRSHTGERPYVCKHNSCGKAFSSATNYRNHMRIHSGEKPYVCPVSDCGKRFTEYSSLYKHKSVHQTTKRYKCCYCGLLCKQESSLRTHKRMVHDIIITQEGTEIFITKDEASNTNLVLEFQGDPSSSFNLN